MTCNFRVGQKVVCVDAGNGSPEDVRGCAQGYLVKGGVYTITGINVTPRAAFLRLAGVASGWVSTRFRPAVERKTDISIFKAMLKDKKTRVSA